MQIIPIKPFNPVNKNINAKRNSLRLSSAPQYDSVCFKSRDLLDLPEKDIMRNIRESINPANFLGQGMDAEVYRIKDTKYCVRLPYEAADMFCANYTRELAPTDKVNHIVAKLGFGAAIMKYFEGVAPKLYMHNESDRHNLQEKIADMPIKSYSEFLHQIANAIDNDMIYDFSGGNLIVDTEKQKLTAIDFYDISENYRQIRPMTEMYHVLTCYGSEEKTGKKIYDKIVDTGLEEYKPANIPCMDLKLFDFIELALKRNCDNHSFRRGNINKNINRFESLLEILSKNLKELQQLKQIEIKDKTVSGILEQKITDVRRILKRVK